MSLLAVLFCIFLVLKLVGVIAWSWWWVTAPLWIPFALASICFAVAAILEFMDTYRRQRNRRRVGLFFIATFLATIGCEAEGVRSYPSGDPTVAYLAVPAAQVWTPTTQVAGAPLALERDPGGTTIGFTTCYYIPQDQLHCTTPSWCVTCSDYDQGVRFVTLSEWCRRLDALPMPQPASPSDRRPVCDPSWR